MGVNCEEDCLISKDGRKLLCHAVRVKEDNQHETGTRLYVQVTQTRDAKGSRVIKKNDRLLVHAGAPVVLGSKENRVIIPAFRIQEPGI